MNISCKDGLNRGQNGMDLTEAEDIKKRWQEYTAGRGDQDAEHVYTRGGFMLIYGKTDTLL